MLRICFYSLAFLGCILPYAVHADITYTIAPLVIDVDAEPRDIIERSITITNHSTQPITVYPTVNNISVDAGGGIEDFIPASMSDRTQSLASWIEIARMGVDLAQDESKTLPLIFRIHQTPVPGTYHAFIGFGFGGNQDEAIRQVERGDAPGTVVSLTIVDKKHTFLKLSRFIIDRFVTGVGNQAAVYTVQNPGEEPLIPKGEIIFYNNRGVEVGTVPVNTDNVTIAPGDEKQFTAEVPTEGLFGKYKAFLSVEYGAELASVQDTAFFYVFPLKKVIPVFIILLIVVAVFSFFVHRKYYGDGDDDGSELLHVHVREGVSEGVHHDINLKQQ